ncbi:MAG: ethanolamine ammonia-lyase subunit EutC [Marinobacter sp.]|uniref:ethanolamine ammonia-lyase subunit EutC n=1 Tax=Marinobacter sp. TaxID=50741 RepID=UPI003C5F40F4
MTDATPELVTDNPWRRLRAYTDARIGLGRAGTSLPTRELLAFQLDHARARDAVHLPLDTGALLEALTSLSAARGLPQPLLLHSEAADRVTYLQRPDLGRRLDATSCNVLDRSGHTHQSPVDLALVVADGLSSRAVQQNAVPLLQAFLALPEVASASGQRAPLCVVTQARVAIGDDIAQRLNARCVVVLIGERPGLSSPDSLGLYLTWAPHPGLTDANRNCISNIRPGGLDVAEASRRLLYLLKEARRLNLSGVGLKDRSAQAVIEQGYGNFLLEPPPDGSKR